MKGAFLVCYEILIICLSIIDSLLISALDLINILLLNSSYLGISYIPSTKIRLISDILVSTILSFDTKVFISFKPRDLIAISIISSSGIPVDWCCLVK